MGTIEEFVYYYEAAAAFVAFLAIAGAVVALAIALYCGIDKEDGRQAAIWVAALMACCFVFGVILAADGGYEQRVCRGAGYWHVQAIDGEKYCARLPHEKDGPALILVSDITGSE